MGGSSDSPQGVAASVGLLGPLLAHLPNAETAVLAARHQRARCHLWEGMMRWEQRPIVKLQKTQRCFPVPSSHSLDGTFLFPGSMVVGVPFSLQQVRGTP